MRTISASFKDDLKTGILSELMNEIKKKNDSIICFRNNYVNIYYKGHSLLCVKEKSKHNYIASFDLGHARYYKEIPAIILDLKKFHIGGMSVIVKLNNNEKKGMKATYLIEFSINNRNNKNNELHFEQLMDLLKKYMDDFFIVGKRYDKFENTERDNKSLREKKHQQKLFMYNSKIQSGLLFYDMELSLPKPKKGSSEEKIVYNEIGGHITGAPDCLALRIENGVAKSIVLVEVKSTTTACEGDHGIQKHSADFNKIIECSYYRNFIKESMEETMEFNKNNGIYENCQKLTIPDSFGEKKSDYEIIYFFTHRDVTEWAENAFNNNDDNAKAYLNLKNSNPEMFKDYSKDMEKLMGNDYN